MGKLVEGNPIFLYLINLYVNLLGILKHLTSNKVKICYKNLLHLIFHHPFKKEIHGPDNIFDFIRKIMKTLLVE